MNLPSLDRHVQAPASTSPEVIAPQALMSTHEPLEAAQSQAALPRTSRITRKAGGETDPAQGDGKSFVCEVDSDPLTGESILTFPREFMAEMDWREGDVIDFSLLERGGLLLTNMSRNGREKPAEMPLFIVETVVSHRVRYAIRAESAEHAMDSVVMNEVEKFDQKPLGEQIFSAREATLPEYLADTEQSQSVALRHEKIHVVKY